MRSKWAMASSCKRFVLGFVVVSLLSLASVECDADGNVLLEIKRTLRDVDNVLYDWTDTPSSDYCVWRGIGCDNVTFNVVALNLSGLNLDGEISSAIGQLKSLVSIDLSRNGLSGQIPDEIGDCSVLQSSVLSFNELYGDIPLSISKLKQLETLLLRDNPIFSTLPSLKTLGLSGKKVQGSLSPDICQLTALLYFDVRRRLNSSSPKLVILHKNMAHHVYKDVMRMMENLSQKCEIGHGASSPVYKCVLENRQAVAVKILNSHDYPQCLKKFVQV